MPAQAETVIFESYANGGDSFARLPDGRAIFVPYVIPGEQARVRLTEEKRGYARGELVEILEAAPERIKPRCPHFPRPGQPGCGGCHYQHLPYTAQLAAKTEILGDQLMRIGKIKTPPLSEIVPAPAEWHYRNQLHFHLSTDGQLGFPNSAQSGILPIQECHLAESGIQQIWPQLDFESVPGLDRLQLRLGADDETLIILESSDPHPVELSVDLPISVIHRGPGGSLVLAGDDHLVVEIKKRLFKVSEGSFLRANMPMIEKMVDFLLEHLPHSAETLIDGYCGAGIFSAFLAPQFNRLIGIERSPSASDDFAINLDEFEHVELYEGALRDVLPALELESSIMVVDPPANGIDRRALDAICALAPKALAYISSNPATLARDAARLITSGYQLMAVTPFDCAPQTAAIDSISIFVK